MKWQGLIFALIVLFVAADGLYYFRNYYHKHLVFERAALPPMDIIFKEGHGRGFKSDILEVKSWAEKNGIVCLSAFYQYLAPASTIDQMPSRRGCIVGGQARVTAPYQYEHVNGQDYLIGTLRAKKPRFLDPQFEEVRQYLKLHQDSMKKSGGALVIYDLHHSLFTQPIVKILTPVADVPK